MAWAVVYLIEQTGDARWARERADAMIYPRHPYGAWDPAAAGIGRPADGEQGDKGIAPSAWTVTFFEGDTSYWDDAWAKVFHAPSRGWG